MTQSPLDAERLVKLRKMAKGISINFWLGVVAVFVSFFEQSPVWTYFVVLTAWIGVVMGLTGGPGFADYLLERSPPRRQVSKGMMIVLSLSTFWIPTLATAVFGLGLAGVLPDNHAPKSHLADNSLMMILQAFAMYFISAGNTWMIVGKEVRLAQQELEATEDAADAL